MFMLTGTFSNAAVATLRASGDAARLERHLAEHVTRLDGTVKRFFFVAGAADFVAIFDAPRHQVGKLLYALSDDALVERGSAGINRVRATTDEVDADLARAAAIAQPWPCDPALGGLSLGA